MGKAAPAVTFRPAARLSPGQGGTDQLEPRYRNRERAMEGWIAVGAIAVFLGVIVLLNLTEFGRPD
jgi:hypothetical protein